MSRGINLLGRKQQTAIAPVQTKLNKMRAFAMGSLFLVSASSIIIFVLITFSPLPAVQRQADTASATLTQSQQTIAKLLLLHDRTNASMDIIKKRTRFVQHIQLITGRLPTGVRVKEFSLSKDTISVTVTSASLAPLDSFVNDLVISADQKKDFKKVALGGLEQTESAFEMTITVTPL